MGKRSAYRRPEVGPAWLLLLYALPTRRSTERVSLWRKLRKFGALQIKSGAYVLPDEAVQHERFQWLSKQIRDGGGEATLIRLTEIEGMPTEKIVQTFNADRGKEYQDLARDLALYMRKDRGRRNDAGAERLERFRRRFREIQEVDYFKSPGAERVRRALQQAERLPAASQPGARLLKVRAYAGRVWMTRPRPHIDRVGSAWLIQRFIDPRARFLFSASPRSHAQALPFDMFEAEFSHHGDDCTFETLVKRFGIKDRAARVLSEMVHDADLEDGKFQRVECIGLDRILKGWCKQGLPDEEILTKGFECFEALYTALQRGGGST